MTQQANSALAALQGGEQALFNRQLRPMQLQQQQLATQGLESQQNIQNTIRNLTNLEGQIAAGMQPDQIMATLTNQRNQILQRGGNPADTDQAIQALQSGGMGGLNQLLTAGRTAFERAGLLQPVGLSQREAFELGTQRQLSLQELKGKQQQELARIKSELEGENDQFDKASKLRKEITSFAKDSGFFDTVTAFDRVKAATAEPSAAGDLALIFNFMKMLDPGSVVREGEFATAQNAAGVPQRVVNLYNNILTGERLSEDQRKDFTNQANNVFRKAETRFKNVIKPTLSIGRDQNLSERDILGEGFLEAFQVPEEEPVAQQPSQQAIQPAPQAPQQPTMSATNPQTGQKIFLVNNQWVDEQGNPIQ